MTNDEQRIAIAEACPDVFRVIHGKTYWKNDDGLCDPLSDLNAMHKAEKTLSQGGKTQYIYHLQTLCGGQQFGDNYFATAAQRAEAFLRVVGRWKTNEQDVRLNNEVIDERT